MGGFAWVTLATNDTYSLGALVLAHSLQQAGTAHCLAVLVTPGVTNSMRQKLAGIFDLVEEVNVLDSKDEVNLRLLKRPELGITFTKLHCWRLTQFEKCVFLDADTLVLKNPDELFEREEFSAAPDVGWPDCFNSGVFVYRPATETYDKLVEFALTKGSFDGGDQGLLNMYFNDWAHKDINRHLPFLYNMCSVASYSYMPAFKHFENDVKIVHFIGATKPWLQYFNTETQKVQPSSDMQHLKDVLQIWWNFFCNLVHSNLNAEMNLSPTIAQDLTAPDHSDVWDPWEDYVPEAVVQFEPQNTNSLPESPASTSFSNSIQTSSLPLMPTFITASSSTVRPPVGASITPPSPTSVAVLAVGDIKFDTTSDSIYMKNDLNSKEELSTNIPNFEHSTTVNLPDSIYSNNPYELVTVTDAEDSFIRSNDGGLAGAFAQFNLGAPRSERQSAMEEHLRRQSWEMGNIDYMGRDSLDKIWTKISETIAAVSESSAEESATAFAEEVKPDPTIEIKPAEKDIAVKEEVKETPSVEAKPIEPVFETKYQENKPAVTQVEAIIDSKSELTTSQLPNLEQVEPDVSKIEALKVEGGILKEVKSETTKIERGEPMQAPELLKVEEMKLEAVDTSKTGDGKPDTQSSITDVYSVVLSEVKQQVPNVERDSKIEEIAVVVSRTEQIKFEETKTEGKKPDTPAEVPKIHEGKAEASNANDINLSTLIIEEVIPDASKRAELEENALKVEERKLDTEQVKPVVFEIDKGKLDIMKVGGAKSEATKIEEDKSATKKITPAEGEIEVKEIKSTDTKPAIIKVDEVSPEALKSDDIKLHAPKPQQITIGKANITESKTEIKSGESMIELSKTETVQVEDLQIGIESENASAIAAPTGGQEEEALTPNVPKSLETVPILPLVEESQVGGATTGEVSTESGVKIEPVIVQPASETKIEATSMEDQSCKALKVTSTAEGGPIPEVVKEKIEGTSDPSTPTCSKSECSLVKEEQGLKQECPLKSENEKGEICPVAECLKQKCPTTKTPKDVTIQEFVETTKPKEIALDPAMETPMPPSLQPIDVSLEAQKDTIQFDTITTFSDATMLATSEAMALTPPTTYGTSVELPADTIAPDQKSETVLETVPLAAVGESTKPIPVPPPRKASGSKKSKNKK